MAEMPIEFFYLWDTKKPVFEIFKIVRLYLRDNALDPALIEAICREKKVNFLEALEDLPLILMGYLEILYPPTENKGKETKNVEQSDTVYD